MVFGDTTGADNTGWIVALGTLALSLAGAIVVIIKGRSSTQTEARKAQVATDDLERKNKERARKSSVKEWQEFSKKLEDQNDRKDLVIRQQTEIIQELTNERTECREESAELRAYVRFLYESYKRLHIVLTDMGQDPGPIHDPPTLRDRVNSDRSNFLIRQAAQTVQTLSESDQVIKNPPKGDKE